MRQNLYCMDCPKACVLFATISNYSDFYAENYDDGIGCLRLLNEIIADFDQVSGRCRMIEKI